MYPKIPVIAMLLACGLLFIGTMISLQLFITDVWFLALAILISFTGIMLFIAFIFSYVFRDYIEEFNEKLEKERNEQEA